MATWAPCCFGGDQSALLSWPAMSPLPQQRAPSALPVPANRARKEPLRVILNGLGKDAAQIISRINGFTYVQTQFDYYTGELKIVKEYKYPRASGLLSAATVRMMSARAWPLCTTRG